MSEMMKCKRHKSTNAHGCIDGVWMCAACCLEELTSQSSADAPPARDEIQRFSPKYDRSPTKGAMRPTKWGGYVRYEDHVAALRDPRAEQVETAIKALERAGNAIHSEYCTRVCHRECVAVDEALALLRQGEAGKE